MIPRIGLDLEPGVFISRILPDLDLLDIAYSACHGGAEAMLVPMSLFSGTAEKSPGLFNRPGLPVLAMKAELPDLDRVSSWSGSVDRVMVMGEGGSSLMSPGDAAQRAIQLSSSGQEVGVLIDPLPSALKELSRARAHWAFFSTVTLSRSASAEEAQDEIARLTSAAVAASRVHLRGALWGPTGRQFPSALAAIPNIEEIYPTPDLWQMALRLGWERAVSEFRFLMH